MPCKNGSNRATFRNFVAFADPTARFLHPAQCRFAMVRPRCVPIDAVTDIESVFRPLLLPWGVKPFLMSFSADPEQTILDALFFLKRIGLSASAAWWVIITNVLANEKIVGSLQLWPIE